MSGALSLRGGAVHGAVRLWLRLEGIAALLLAIALYRHMGESWTVFAVLFFVPDVSFAAYLGGPRIGAAFYNVAHSYVSPLLLAGTFFGLGTGLAPALIWAAHIGFDRALGYGLKYPTAFGDTHLGRIGRGANQPESTTDVDGAPSERHDSDVRPV
jgi:hypothetical protein